MTFPVRAGALQALYALSFVALLTLPSQAASAQDDPTRVRTTKKAPVKTQGFFGTGHVGSGLGLFQDIQVPRNEEANIRADGSTAGTENVTHTGFPLFAGLGILHRMDQLSFDLGAEAMQIRATTGPAETQSSSYARLDLSAGAKYAIPLEGQSSIVVGGGFGARRSAFNNVSNGHTIASMLFRGSLAYAGPARIFEVHGGFAPTAAFGYSKGGGFGFGSESFAKSEASLFEMGASASFSMRNGVWLDTGVEQETARVTIEDVTEYDGFGLNVGPVAERQSRVYDLATTVMRIGLRKEF